MLKLFLAICICMAGTLVHAQVKNFLDVPYIETFAKVDTFVTPDRIYLDISILESDSKDKIPLEKLENIMAKELESLGINVKEQLKVISLSSDFRNYFLQRAEASKSKSYSLLVYNAQTAGKVIQSLESVGISNVTFRKAEYSKIDELGNEVLVHAVLLAKQKATLMLSALNQKAGQVLFVSELSPPVVYPTYVSPLRYLAQDEAAVKSEPVDLDFYQIQIEKQVSVKFQIE